MDRRGSAACVRYVTGAVPATRTAEPRRSLRADLRPPGRYRDYRLAPSSAPDRPVRPTIALPGPATPPSCGGRPQNQALRGYTDRWSYSRSGVDLRYVCRLEEDGSWLTR